LSAIRRGATLRPWSVQGSLTHSLNTSRRPMFPITRPTESARFVRPMSIFSSLRTKKEENNQQDNENALQELERQRVQEDLQLLTQTIHKFPHYISAVETFLRTLPEGQLGRDWMVSQNRRNMHEEKEIKIRAGVQATREISKKTAPYGVLPNWRLLAGRLKKKKDLGDYRYRRTMKILENLSEEDIAAVQRARHVMKQVDVIADEAKIYRPPTHRNKFSLYLHVDDQSTPRHHYDVHGQNIQQGKTIVILRAPGQLSEEYLSRVEGLRVLEKEIEREEIDEVIDEDKDILPWVDPMSNEGIGPNRSEFGGPEPADRAEPYSTHTDIDRRMRIRGQILRSLKDPKDVTATLSQLNELSKKIEDKISANPGQATVYDLWKDVAKQMTALFENCPDLEKHSKEEIEEAVSGYEVMDVFKDRYDPAEDYEPESIDEIKRYHKGNFQHRRWGVIDWSKRTFTVNEYNLVNGRRFSNVIVMPFLWFNSFKEVYWPPVADSIDYAPLNYASYLSQVQNQYVVAPKELKVQKDAEAAQIKEKQEQADKERIRILAEREQGAAE